MTNVATLQTAADLSASITAQGISSLVPAGVIMAFGGATAPTGWLLCNGSAVSRTTYADLFAAISTAHGYGDNSTTFNLPDYRGRFIRGRDGAIARDPDRAARTAAATGGNTGDNVGSVQGIAVARPTTAFTSGGMSANTTHTHTSQNLNVNAVGVQTGSGAIGSNPGTGGLTLSSPNIDHSHTITGGGDNETRPLNAYVNYIIKI